ncbi:MAG: hypothetical protein NZL89_07105, partial [Leptospiraceae bacterium]|nr:hypothetical protein [Leptospiraceae bacterium]
MRILQAPFTFIHFLIRVQETKTYSFYTVLAFVFFTGAARGLEEILIFGIPLKNSEVLLFLHFYLSLAIVLTAGISAIGGLPWPKVFNTVLIGIFLGIFPPLFDVLLGSQNVFYGFYFIHDFRELPWLGYKPEFNYPLGECLTIWLSIVFSGYYVWYKTHSWLRAVFACSFAWTGFVLFGSLLPMLVAYLAHGHLPDVASARRLDENLLRAIACYIAFAQSLAAALAWLLLRRSLLWHLLRRSLHALPFVLLVFLGAAANGKTGGHAVLAAGVI